MATATSSTDELQIRCPATGELIGTAPIQSAADVTEIASQLRAAQPAWEALGFKGRAYWLERWRDWVLDNSARLNKLIQLETGKSWNDACVEVPTALEVINYYVRHGEAFLEPERPRPHTPAMAMKRLEIVYSPHQLVGDICPWNAPLGVPFLDIPAAMLAGCAVLTKPSEVTPLAWRETVEGWKRIGAPAILDVVTGGGETGAAVVDVVDMVQFTGSVGTGRRIAIRCAERLIPCSLELGGKDPMLVLEDADIERAANAALFGAFFNSGQICVSVERAYVVESVYDDFLGRVTEKARKLRQGMERDQNVNFDIGAMANEDQLEIVERHVEDALAKGAKVLTGGRRREPGLFYEPTVLVDVDHTMACMREETFGPLLPIVRVRDEEEAISMANDSPYGLSASVFTKDRGRGRRVAQRLYAGGVNVNDVYINVFQMPLPQGGWGESGIGGRQGGAAGIRKFCKEQAVVSTLIAPKNEITWYPASNRRLGLQAKAIRFLGARDWRRKLGLKPRS